MQKNATFILNLMTDKSISDTATMESILESGEAVDYLRSIADQ